MTYLYFMKRRNYLMKEIERIKVWSGMLTVLMVIVVRHILLGYSDKEMLWKPHEYWVFYVFYKVVMPLFLLLLLLPSIKISYKLAKQSERNK